MRLKVRGTKDDSGSDVFQFNCCAIKGAFSDPKGFPFVSFQFNCCAIKGGKCSVPVSWKIYFNSTVVRLKGQKIFEHGEGVDISIQLLCD